MSRGLLALVAFSAVVWVVWAVAIAAGPHKSRSDRALIEAQALQAVSVYASQQSWEIERLRVVGVSYPKPGLAVVDVKFVRDGADNGDMLVHLTDSRWSLVGLN